MAAEMLGKVVAAVTGADSEAKKEEEESPRLVKALLVGQEKCGKSSMLLRFADNSFTESYISTIGVDFRIKEHNSPELGPHKFQIWDTAGQERFRTITSAYYRGAHLIWLCFDVNDRKSFEALSETWLPEVLRHSAALDSDQQPAFDDEDKTRPRVAIGVLGLKAEEEEEEGDEGQQRRQVSADEAEDFVLQHDVLIKYHEVSAKKSTGIEEVAEIMCRMHAGLENNRGRTVKPARPSA